MIRRTVGRGLVRWPSCVGYMTDDDNLCGHDITACGEGGRQSLLARPVRESTCCISCIVKASKLDKGVMTLACLLVCIGGLSVVDKYLGCWYSR